MGAIIAPGTKQSKLESIIPSMPKPWYLHKKSEQGMLKEATTMAI